MPRDVRCYCGAAMVALPSAYGSRVYYRCSEGNCEGVIGAYPDGTPVGTPANKATRQARILAHDAFDSLWRTGGMRRSDAYAWLAQTTGVRHIADATLDDCDRVIRACADKTKGSP